MLISILYFILGLIMLYYGAEYLIDNGKKIANIFDISPIVIGITIVAFGTSLPEMVVSILSNLNGEPGIALGNIIGSNISNIGLVLGLTCIIKPININYKNSKFDFLFLSFISVLLFFFCFYGLLNRYVGSFFIILLIVYLKKIITNKKFNSDQKNKNDNLFLLILIIIISSFVLFLGTEFFIKGAKGIAFILGIDGTVVGLTIIAFGTSAPELSASLIALKKNEFEIILGNIIGSNIFNILAVLGLTTIIKPIEIQHDLPMILIIFISLTISLPVIIYFRNRLNRFVGFLYFSIYILFLYQSFNIN